MCDGCGNLREEPTHAGRRCWCEYARIVYELGIYKPGQPVKTPDWCLVRMEENHGHVVV